MATSWMRTFLVSKNLITQFSCLTLRNFGHKTRLSSLSVCKTCSGVKNFCCPSSQISNRNCINYSIQRLIQTSATCKGLEEFFESKENWGSEFVKSGREWKMEELRLKDNEDLHKLWYILLKEKNMLLTMETESERQEKYMPSPERLGKVNRSMYNLKQVMKERDEAVNMLTIGRKEVHPGQWQYNRLGFMVYRKPIEHLIPKYMNRKWSNKRPYIDAKMKRYIVLWMEQEKKRRLKAARSNRSKIKRLKKKFPDADIWEDDEGGEREQL